jgi:hypothetical protein
MEATKPQLQFSFQGIKVEQYAVFEENYNSKKEIEIGLEIEFKLNIDNKQIGVFITIQYDQGKHKILIITVSCHFRIEDETWKSLMHDEGCKFIVPKQFSAHFAMLSVSTTRGVLFAKSEGTFCSQFIVPLINVTEIITQDAVFEIK